MRPSDFLIEVEEDAFFDIPGVTRKRANGELLDELRRHPLAEQSDVEVGVGLARLVRDGLQAYRHNPYA